ncbi:DUF378 domain-containing protein [Clostridium hydrogeniformans]|uniref:DUF378 domain-containing protein n=1 Tax=Clostridium hydrogeniformans TaxID=349933 RepID=UPI0004898EAB|nr:DUF378 domain-containing protein [Clostridium hydrogeniformans]
MYKLNSLDKLAAILVLIGALNLGLIGVSNIDLVGLLFSKIPAVHRGVYILVGVSALYLVFLISKSKKALISK